MTSLLPLLLLSSILLISTVNSAVFYERQRSISGFESLCYDKKENIFYKNGEEMKWKMEGCGRQICRGSNRKEWVYIEIQTCGKVHVPPECHSEVNLNLPYPQCCEKVICDSEKTIPESFSLQNVKY